MGKRRKFPKSESDFEPIIEEIKQEFILQKIYFDYVHAEANDQLDIKGIDFLIFYKSFGIPLQLKSFYNEEKLKYHFTRYNLPIMFINDKAEIKNIKSAALDLLEEWEKNESKARKLVYVINGEVKKFYYKK